MGSGLPWAAALTAGFLLTALWYRRTARRTGAPAPRLRYLITGLALTVAATVLPVPASAQAPFPAWFWLAEQSAGGTFALLAVAIGLGVLARQVRSRALGITVLAYTAAVLLVDWPAIRGAWPALTYHGGDPWSATVAALPQSQRRPVSRGAYPGESPASGSCSGPARPARPASLARRTSVSSLNCWDHPRPVPPAASSVVWA